MEQLLLIAQKEPMLGNHDLRRLIRSFISFADCLTLCFCAATV